MRFCGSTFWFGYGTPVFIRPFALVNEMKSRQAYTNMVLTYEHFLENVPYFC